MELKMKKATQEQATFLVEQFVWNSVENQLDVNHTIDEDDDDWADPSFAAKLEEVEFWIEDIIVMAKEDDELIITEDQVKKAKSILWFRSEGELAQ